MCVFSLWYFFSLNVSLFLVCFCNFNRNVSTWITWLILLVSLKYMVIIIYLINSFLSKVVNLFCSFASAFQFVAVVADVLFLWILQSRMKENSIPFSSLFSTNFLLANGNDEKSILASTGHSDSFNLTTLSFFG